MANGVNKRIFVGLLFCERSFLLMKKRKEVPKIVTCSSSLETCVCEFFNIIGI